VIVSSASWLGFRFMRSPLSHAIACKRSIANLRQQDARNDFPEYPSQVQRHFYLLRLSLKHLSHRLNISHIEAWAILNSPDIIPRPELIPLIEDALLLPRGYFTRGKAADGSKYGRELTKARLKWHQERWGARVFLLQPPNLERGTSQRLAKILHDLESQLEAKLIWRPTQ
jgi:hypothetical protein